jgi:malate dehydrogenase (oxaloacetate-decarboxylating)
MAVDYVYRLDQPHRTGQLARLCEKIAEGEGLIGDIRTISIGRDRSLREVNVEVRDVDQADALARRLEELEEVRVISYYDRALSRHVGGKLEMDVRVRLQTLQDLRDIYTPGVARVCMAIHEDPALASRFSMIGRTLAICTNGSRVLGLGDIGPVASMPVMEGKAVLYRMLAGLSAVPILVDTHDIDEFVETVERIAPGFGAIHLEDIRVPECFEIEARLIEGLDKPVMHDDVHGTGVATLAAIIVACRQVGRELDEVAIGQIGLGAAGFGIANLCSQAGASVMASDPNEAAHDRARAAGIRITDYPAVMREADIVVATTGRPGLIDARDVHEGQVILALSNPDPEIRPEAALRAGASFAADGSSVNNVLGFPGIFRGALASGAAEISTGMKLAAATRIADLTEESELVPDAMDRRVHEAVADAVADAAKDEGLDRPERVPEGL